MVGRPGEFEAAMGPMIGASIVAIDHELDPPLLTLMVGVGGQLVLPGVATLQPTQYRYSTLIEGANLPLR